MVLPFHFGQKVNQKWVAGFSKCNNMGMMGLGDWGFGAGNWGFGAGAGGLVVNSTFYLGVNF
jgi:hypothetical protein